MAVILHKLKRNLTIGLMLIWCLNITLTVGHRRKSASSAWDSIVDRVWHAIDNPFIDANYELADGITIKRGRSLLAANANTTQPANTTQENFLDRVTRFASTREVDVKLSKVFPVERMQRSMTTGEFIFYQ